MEKFHALFPSEHHLMSFFAPCKWEGALVYPDKCLLYDSITLYMLEVCVYFLSYNSICYNNFYIFVPEFNLSNLMEELNRIKVALVQNMDDFKSRSFDFYANAQYPLIMKQQSISDTVLKDLFGISGKEFNDLKAAIAALQKGELIIKDNTATILGIGNKWKKIKVTHLI